MIVGLLTLLILSWTLMFMLERKRSKVEYDGKIVILVAPNGNKIFSLELDGDPEDLEFKDTVSFKVVIGDEEEAA